MPPNDDHILMHALGLPNPRGSYRNYFNASEGSDDDASCRRLVARGLMVERNKADHPMIPGAIYHATPAGYAHVGAKEQNDAR